MRTLCSRLLFAAALAGGLFACTVPSASPAPRGTAGQPLVIEQATAPAFTSMGTLRGVNTLTASPLGSGTLLVASSFEGTVGVLLPADGGAPAQRLVPPATHTVGDRALGLQGVLSITTFDANLGAPGPSTQILDGGALVREPMVTELGPDGGLLVAYAECPTPQTCALRTLPLSASGQRLPGVTPTAVSGGAGRPVSRPQAAWNESADAGLVTWLELTPTGSQVRAATLDRAGSAGTPFDVAMGTRQVVVPRGDGFEVVLCTLGGPPELLMFHVPAGASAPGATPVSFGAVATPLGQPAAAVRGGTVLVAWHDPGMRQLALHDGTTVQPLTWVGTTEASTAPLALAATADGWLLGFVEGDDAEVRTARLTPTGGLSRPSASVPTPVGLAQPSIAFDGTDLWLLAVPEGPTTWLEAFKWTADAGWARAVTLPLNGGDVGEVALAADQGQVVAAWIEASSTGRRLLARALTGPGVAAGQVELAGSAPDLESLRFSARDGGFLAAWQSRGTVDADLWLRALTPGAPLSTPTHLDRPGRQRPTSLVPWGTGWALGLDESSLDGGVRPALMTFDTPDQAPAATTLALRGAPIGFVYAMSMATAGDALFATWTEPTATGLQMSGVRVGADRAVASWAVGGLSTANVSGESLVVSDGAQVVVSFVELSGGFRLGLGRFTLAGDRRAAPERFTLGQVGSTTVGSIGSDGRGRTVAAIPVRVGTGALPPIQRLELLTVLNLAGGAACDVAQPQACASGVCLAGLCAAAEVPLGGACQVAASCLSGHCTEGVCCESACGGGTNPCQACSRAKGSSTDGRCEALSATTVCAMPGACLVAQCDGAGTCQAAMPLDAGVACDGGVCTEAGVCEAPPVVVDAGVVDAGTEPQPEPVTPPKGCGCSAVGLEPWALLLALGAVARRRLPRG